MNLEPVYRRYQGMFLPQDVTYNLRPPASYFICIWLLSTLVLVGCICHNDVALVRMKNGNLLKIAPTKEVIMTVSPLVSLIYTVHM